MNFTNLESVPEDRRALVEAQLRKIISDQSHPMYSTVKQYLSVGIEGSSVNVSSIFGDSGFRTYFSGAEDDSAVFELVWGNSAVEAEPLVDLVDTEGDVNDLIDEGVEILPVQDTIEPDSSASESSSVALEGAEIDSLNDVMTEPSDSLNALLSESSDDELQEFLELATGDSDVERNNAPEEVDLLSEFGEVDQEASAEVEALVDEVDFDGIEVGEPGDDVDLLSEFGSVGVPDEAEYEDQDESLGWGNDAVSTEAEVEVKPSTSELQPTIENQVQAESTKVLVQPEPDAVEAKDKPDPDELKVAPDSELKAHLEKENLRLKAENEAQRMAAMSNSPTVYGGGQPENSGQSQVGPNLSKAASNIIGGTAEAATGVVLAASGLFKGVGGGAKALGSKFWKQSADTIDKLEIKAPSNNDNVIELKAHLDKKLNLTPEQALQKLDLVKHASVRAHTEIITSVIDDLRENNFSETEVVKGVSLAKIGSAIDKADKDESSEQFSKMALGAIVASGLEPTLREEITFRGTQYQEIADQLENVKDQALKLDWSEDEYLKRVVEPVSEWLKDDEKEFSLLGKVIGALDKDSDEANPELAEANEKLREASEALAAKLRALIDRLMGKDGPEKSASQSMSI